MSLEQPNYQVLYKSDGIEYRQYESYLVAETLVENTSDYKAAGNQGFRRLFRYISGGNRGEQKIAMTSPVAQAPAGEKIAMTAPVQQSAGADGWRIAFMLPTGYDEDTAPVPMDPQIYIRRVPERLVAVVRFSGRWTSQNFDDYRAALVATLAAEGITLLGEPGSALYNAPYVPPFLRRNEVMVAVDRLPQAAGTEMARAGMDRAVECCL